MICTLISSLYVSVFISEKLAILLLYVFYMYLLILKYILQVSIGMKNTNFSIFAVTSIDDHIPRFIFICISEHKLVFSLVFKRPF